MDNDTQIYIFKNINSQISMYANARLEYTECGAIGIPDPSLTGTQASVRVPKSTASASVGPPPGPRPASGTAGVGRVVHSSPALGWAGPAAGLGAPARARQSAAGRPGAGPVSPGTRPDCGSDPGHQAASRALARDKCARLLGEVSLSLGDLAREEVPRATTNSTPPLVWGRLSPLANPLPQPPRFPPLCPVSPQAGLQSPCRPPDSLFPRRVARGRERV